MTIRRLPTLLINQIAAGEVIERPASVVKELLENSLDAGATRIDIAAEQGGAALIRISDNGSGISADELPLAVAAHATSKLATAEDLAAIGTLGFRGEALASIASVSRLKITSRPTSDGQVAEAAASIQAAGEQVEPVMPAATAPGTVVEVRDLFFNTPARRKFMRSAATEIGHISETVQRAAMAQPRVAFTLTHNERQILDLPATQSPARRCLDILGKDLAEGVLEFSRRDDRDGGRTCVWGLAGQPALCRSSGKFLFLCLNGRPIKDRGLIHAAREAYRGLIPPDKQPVAVVFVTMDPAAVDVNVHPTKAEVRFHQPSQIHGLVLTAMRQCLLGSDLTPAATFPDTRPSGFRFAPGPALPPAMSGAPDALVERASRPSSLDDPIPNHHTPLSSDQFVDYFKRMDPTQKGFVYQQVKQAYGDETPDDAGNESPASRAVPGPGSAPALPHSRSMLQIHDSYVVTQDDQGLIIVDQHALHERVMFEELRRRVLGENKKLESQRLLMPAVVSAGPARQALLEDLTPLLDRIGIEASPIGPDAVAVQAFPTFLFDRHVEPIAFMEELLDKAEAGELAVNKSELDAGVAEAALHEVLDMMSCKAAVKAGDKLTESEIAALLAKRDQIERSSNCPHGRPTTLRLSLHDLAKQFKRS